ncbi:ammonium transporter [Chloropicon primus]|uniref:Ammonium transporter n=1 Tax=Chloropicon primus TaxID=1764295 RepID=A0A5B8MF13_9CHLO|nr:ammonium transporter [Chloropicon primus]|mmetsp:Transcript_11968/g.33089  ORF Transcript_11968/g.33089 Transcript_11968/m.33089 type:complete len:501 (+) Transcript_11968:75-1577(+)|eukprot:QDZ18871.1 ammonium transporter [Chloropicon primus]
MDAATGDGARPLVEAAQVSYVTSDEFTTVVDHLWLLICAFLVFLMQAGFAMLEVGTVRQKNAKNLMIKNIMDLAAGAFVWWAFGFAFAYGGGDYSGGPSNGFIGAQGFFFIKGYDACDDASEFCLYPIKPKYDSFAGWLFQWAFAATATTIVSGAVAERCSFLGYVIYAVFITGFIYPVVVHWIWSEYGWLSAFRNPDAPGVWIASGVVDFAGSGVVHLVGGTISLVAAYILGPRIGRFDATGKVVPIMPHNSAFVGLGTLLLWFGWFGFNSGSTLALSGGFILAAEKVAVGTTLAASGGGLAGICMCFVKDGYLDLPALCNGILGGLVGVCSAVAVAEPWACWVIGFFAGCVEFWFAIGVQKLKIDDPLDASAVHMGCGFFGLICGGLFGTRLNTDATYSADQPCGAFFPGCGGQQLGVNILGGVMIMVWCSGMAFLVFGGMRLAGILRISSKQEHEGLDVSYHGSAAYDDTMDGSGSAKYRNKVQRAMIAEEVEPPTE